MIMGGTTLPTMTPLSAQGAIVGTHRSPSPIQVTSSPPHTHPTSYLGAVLQPMGGTPLSLSSTAKEPSSLPHLWATTAQAAIPSPPMARRSRPRRRPGRQHRPRAPGHSDRAFPSHPHSTLGGTFQRKPHARRVCRHHGPRAPSLGSLCGRRHRPRAPSLPEAF
jgi:hypothetical protein